MNRDAVHTQAQPLWAAALVAGVVALAFPASADDDKNAADAADEDNDDEDDAAGAPARAEVAPPKLGTERLIFHTNVGDIAVALYPADAPQTVAQFLTLARAHVFDDTDFFRLEKGFVLQLNDTYRRNTPLDATQRALVKRLPLEGKSLVHDRGVLSMARQPNDPDSSETSFSIVLGGRKKVRHLDGQYTPFGQIVAGEDVLAAIETIGVSGNRPRSHIVMRRVEVLPDAAALAQTKLTGPTLPTVEDNIPPEETNPLMVVRTTVGDMLFVLRPDIAPKTVAQLQRIAGFAGFDGSTVIRVRPDLMQLDGVSRMWPQLTKEERDSIVRLPVEADRRLTSKRGALQLAHAVEDPESGQASLCILFGPAPHLDGKYTFLGELLDGETTLAALQRTDTGGTEAPVSPITVTEVHVVPPGSRARVVLAPPRGEAAAAAAPSAIPLLWSIAVMMALGIGIFVATGRVSTRVAASLGLVVVLAGAIGMFTVLAPLAALGTSGALSTGVFLALIGLFKLMNRFEGQTPGT